MINQATIKDTIIRAYKETLISTVRPEPSFNFPLDSGLSILEQSGNTCLIGFNPHNAIQTVPVAFASIQNGNINLVTSNDIDYLRIASYYNLQAPLHNDRCFQLNSDLKKLISPQLENGIKESVYTNIDMQQRFKSEIEKYLCEGKQLPDFIHSEQKNGFISFYIEGKDLACIPGYDPPDRVSIGKATIIPVQDGQNYCIIATTKDSNAIFDCYAEKRQQGIMSETLQINVYAYMQALDSETTRIQELNNAITNIVQEHFGNKYLSTSVAHLSEAEKRMFYNAFEQEAEYAIVGYNTQWLSKTEFSIKDNVIYYGDNEIGIVGDGYISLTSCGLDLCNSIISKYTPHEIETFKNEFNFDKTHEINLKDSRADNPDFGDNIGDDDLR